MIPFSTSYASKTSRTRARKINMKILNLILLPIFFALCSAAYSKQVSEGMIRVNNQDLKAVLFDDPALNPACRQKINDAMQAMFYLNGQSFAHGCWIPLDGEIHTQMTRYDTNETRSFVFAVSLFHLTNPTTAKNPTNIPKVQRLESIPAWCPNAKFAHEITICSDEDLSSKEIQILKLYTEYSKNQALTAEALKSHKSDYFKKLKACGSNKECISMQQDARLKFYKSANVVGQ